MYWKVSESEAHWFMQAIHGGDGEIRRRGFFKDVMKLPVDFEVWELAPGVSEGMHVHDGETMLEELYYFLEGEGVMWVRRGARPHCRGGRSAGAGSQRSRLQEHRQRTVEAGAGLG